MKFCKDRQLTKSNSTFRVEDVDIVFAKHKELGQRHLSRVKFTYALKEIAELKGTTLNDLLLYIIKQQS